MTSTARRILNEALALRQEEREELVGALSNSLEPIELSPEWEAEIARRVRKIETGEAVLQDAEDHLRKLQAKYSG
ncbi:MAG: addiction module protein [Proteobacteria bacterium]|nr:addiction module protein [Pseudomonadota bacterium]